MELVTILVHKMYIDLGFNMLFWPWDGIFRRIIFNLFFAHVHLKGTSPSSIDNFQVMSFLLLFYFDISATIPGTISALTSLSHLCLHWNSLSGTISGSLSALIQLVDARLYRKSLTGTIPRSISGWRLCPFVISTVTISALTDLLSVVPLNYDSFSGTFLVL